MLNFNIKNNKGITLVELILTLAVAAIVIPLVFAIITFGVKAFNVSSDQTSIQQEVRNQGDYIMRDIRKAKEVSIDPSVFRDQSYFSFSLKSYGSKSYLVHGQWTKGTLTKETKIGDFIYNLIFLPHDKGGALGVKIENQLNKQIYSLDFEVMMDNIKNKIIIPQGGVSTIYYTLYGTDT